MKKRISFLFACVMVALTLIMPCVADEETTDLVTEITTEMVTEVMTEEATEPTEDTTAVETETEPVEDETALGGVVAPAEGENAPTEENSAPTNDVDEWENFKAKISDTATWTMIATAIVTILTTIGTIKSKFDKIASLVHNKADNETLQGAIKDMEKELRNAYNANHKEVAATMKRYEEALKNTEANEQRLYAILTLFMTNCKISESAKAEILNILADVKKYEGDISEFVTQAQEAIDKEIAEKEAQAPATPTLDSLLEEDYMELG